jgi:hypothetical protein
MFRFLFQVMSIIAVAGSLVGCGRGITRRGIDPIFQPSVNAFIADGAKYGRPNLSAAKIDIFFGTPDLGVEVVGECKNSYEVIIDPNYWHAFDKEDGSLADQQKALIYHELGHCILNQAHRPGDFNPSAVTLSISTADPSAISGASADFIAQIPVSIMNPDVISGLDLVTYQDYYLKELFSN